MPDDPLTPPAVEAIPKEVVPEEVSVPVEAQVSDLPPLPKAGVSLARWLLIIISSFVVLMVVWIVVSESLYFHWISSQHSSLQTEDVNAIIREHETFREFWLKIFQMVLLNTLLPVLTAVLGYVFGSRPS
jgi:hypothetical protein